MATNATRWLRIHRPVPVPVVASEAIRYAAATAAIDHLTGPRPQLSDAPGENRHALARGLQLRACLCPSHSSSEWQGKGYREREYSTTKCMPCIRHRHRCSRSRGLNRHSSVCTAPRHASRTTTIPTCKCIRGPLPAEPPLGQIATVGRRRTPLRPSDRRRLESRDLYERVGGQRLRVLVGRSARRKPSPESADLSLRQSPSRVPRGHSWTKMVPTHHRQASVGVGRSLRQITESFESPTPKSGSKLEAP